MHMDAKMTCTPSLAEKLAARTNKGGFGLKHNHGRARHFLPYQAQGVRDTIMTGQTLLWGNYKEMMK